MEQLSLLETRILGSLIEKQFATPDYYPLTINSLKNACNQKSNRSPVVDFDDETIREGLDSLLEKQLVRNLTGNRAIKYYHKLDETFSLSSKELFILSLLFLKGPLTIGEINTQSKRLINFANLEEVENLAENLLTRDDPLILKLEKRAGQKEHRYCHLFSEITNNATELEPVLIKSDSAKRLDELEDKVKTLESLLEDLSLQFQSFKKQFE